MSPRERLIKSINYLQFAGGVKGFSFRGEKLRIPEEKPDRTERILKGFEINFA